MFRTAARAWMTATAAEVEPLMNRSWTKNTERAISDNQGIAIAVVHVCTSHGHPLGSVSGASEHNIRGRRAGSFKRETSRVGLSRQGWRGMSASCRISPRQSWRSFMWLHSQGVGARPRAHGAGTRAVHPGRARHGAPATPRPASAPARRRSGRPPRSSGGGVQKGQVLTKAMRSPVRPATRWMRGVARASARSNAGRLAGMAVAGSWNAAA
jgi:hypothetical protein